MSGTAKGVFFTRATIAIKDFCLKSSEEKFSLHEVAVTKTANIGRILYDQQLGSTMKCEILLKARRSG